MKRTQLAILVLLVIVLGAAAWFLIARRTGLWQSSAGHLPDRIVALPMNDVARVTITQPAAKVNLVKKDNTWVVAERANYPADFEVISTFIRKVWELKPVQEVKVGASQLGRLELIEPGTGDNSGTLVDFRDAAGKRLAALLFGKKYLRESAQSFAAGRSFPVGRYVMPMDNAHTVSLVSDSFPQIDEKPERWLDRHFIKIEKPTSIASAGPMPDMNWKLERSHDSAEWRLAGAAPEEKLDETKARQVASAVNSLSTFTDVLAPETKPETLGLDKPRAFTFTTEEGITYAMNVGHPTNESYPVTVTITGTLPTTRTAAANEKPEDKEKLDKEFQTKHEASEKRLKGEKKLEGRIFQVPKYGITQLEKARADLLAKPTPTPTSTPAASPGAPSPSPTAKSPKFPPKPKSAHP